jgi:raffinose/stachyose/melibiose transport system substrate-binding protein
MWMVANACADCRVALDESRRLGKTFPESRASRADGREDIMTAKTTRRTVLKTAALAGAGAVLSPLVLRSAQAQAGELSFWTWRQEDRTQYAQLFGAFTAKNPTVKIGYQAFEPQNYGTALSTALAAGKGPDLIHIRAYGGTEQFAKAGYLMPLDTDAVPELKGFRPDALASTTMRADKKIYAVPFASQTLGIFINRALFDQHGQKVPTTWAEFIETCKAFKGKGVIPLANGMATAFMVEIFAGIFTASFLGEGFAGEIVSGKATFADPRYVGALEKLTELRDYLPPGFAGIDYPTMQQLFLSGRAAMFAGGSFEIANFRRQNPNLKMEFHAPPAPKAGDKRLVSLFYDGGYAINAKATRKDDCVKVLRYLATKEFGDKFSELLGNISPIPGVEAKDPMLAAVAKLNAESVPYIMLVHFRYENPTGSQLLQQGVQKLMAGQAKPADVGTEVTKGIATYFAPFKK